MEEINAAIEMGKRRNFFTPEDQLSAEGDFTKELPGDVEPVYFPNSLADFCQVKDDVN